MFSGTWYIVIEGLSFAFVRTFTLTVGLPVIVTVSFLPVLVRIYLTMSRKHQQVKLYLPEIQILC